MEERYTNPESQIKAILEGIGYSVREWSRRLSTDPFNIVYFQMPIKRHKNNRDFCADFAFPFAQIDLEVDGEYWHRQISTRRIEDKSRDRELRNMGWKVLRLPSHIVSSAIASRLQNSIFQLMDV